MSANNTLLIDSMAAHTVIQFVISVLTDEQKERLKELADFPSPTSAEANVPEELRGYMKELHAKVQEIIDIGTAKF